MGVRERGLAVVVAAVMSAMVGGAFGALPAFGQNPALPPNPIPGGMSSAPEFEGSVATPNPINGVTQPPRHPYMAPNGRSNLHDDAYQTDTYEVSGPLGDGAEVSTLFFRECASVMFDSFGRIVTICVGLDRPVLALLDPHTLQTLAALQLPSRSLQSSSGNPFNDFSGGGYFYLDHRDRAVLNTNERHVLEVAITGGPGFAITRDYDLSGDVPANDGVISVLPDWEGTFWFITRRGLVGTIDRGSGKVQTLRLKDEGISNSFAVDDKGGVFIVSDAALYRFDAGPNGEPSITWRQSYPDSGVHKPGQSDAGSGTTPTLMGKRFVTITDNADPMNIQVYRRGTRIKPDRAKRRRVLSRIHSAKARKRVKRRWRNRRREVCSAPVFEKGAGSTDQSLIAAGNSIIAENNFGYSGVAATELGGTTSPGLARVDVVSKGRKKGRKGRGKGGKKSAVVALKRKRKGKTFTCRKVWTSQERAPSVVPKLSLGNGLVYTYTKPQTGSGEDNWFFTAIDFRSGATVYRRFAGEGLGYNNNFAPVTLGPDGTAYVGALGGLVAYSP